MKKIFTLFLFLICLTGVRAQIIPGYNFESWSDGDTSAPDGWQCHNNNVNGFHAVSKSTDSYAGLYSVKLAIQMTAGVDTIVGRIESKLAGGQEGLNPCYPVSVAYTSLKGFYKYVSVAGDSAQIFAPLFKAGYAHSQGFGNILAFGAISLGAAATFTPFSATITYDSLKTPDSAYISIGAFKEIDITNGSKLPPHGNSVLYVDALNYDTYITVGIDNRADITNNFALYPSAGTGALQVSFETALSDFTTLKVYDLTAREIKNLFTGELNAGFQSFNFNLNDVPNGSYLFVVATGKGYRAEKFSIIR